MDIYFATTNSGKFEIVYRELKKRNIKVIQQKIDLNEPRNNDVGEIAKAKIRQAFEMTRKPTIVIDSGFFIDGLKGFPGAFVNFSLNTIGIDGILRLVGDKNKECEFKQCMAYMDETSSEPKLFFKITRGTLTDRKKGTMQPHLWSELSTIFIPENAEKTLAEISYEEYLAWEKTSGIRSPSTQLAEWLSERKGQMRR